MGKINMYTKIYMNGLPKDAKEIRKSVFIAEQGFQNEFDDIDDEAAHIVIYSDKDLPAAVCRVFQAHETETFFLGRLAVLKEYRGKSIGADVIKEAEKYVREKGGHRIDLHAQCRVSSFYQKLGFTQYGEIEDDEGCPHVWMSKLL